MQAMVHSSSQGYKSGPVILAKRIAVTKFRRVLRLTTRYSPTILINPLYLQATQLMNWSKENERMLLAYTLRSSSESSESLNLASVEDETVSISGISSFSATVQTFHVEGQISLPNYPQSFCMLACSNCNHFVRSKVRREVQCLSCDLPRMLVPRIWCLTRWTGADGRKLCYIKIEPFRLYARFPSELWL